MPIFTCNICNKSLDCFSKLKLHELSHSNVRPFTCEECGKKFRRKSHLKDHLYLHSKIKEHKCEQCNKCFASLSILKRHAKRHLFQRIFKCQHCSKSFFELSKLRRHFDSHSGFRPHQCGYCQRAFIHQADLKRHLLTHTQVSAATQSDPDSPTDKRRLANKRKPKNLKCEHCGKILATALSYKEHLNIHMGTKPHKCDQCDKTFNKQIELQRHLMRHSGHRPYACLDCDRCFFSQSELGRHAANQHLQLSVLRCDHCTASFCELTHLNEHMQSHFVTDDAYMCNYCGVHFEIADDLHLHQQALHHNPASFPFIKIENISLPFLDYVKVSSPAKKFVCTICLKLFRLKCLLTNHMRTHRPMRRVHRCAQCSASFSHRYHLLAHSLTHRQNLSASLYTLSYVSPILRLDGTEKKSSRKLTREKLQVTSPTTHQNILAETNLGVKQKRVEKLTHVTIKVDSSHLNKDPIEMWESVRDRHKNTKEMEVVACNVKLTFCLRNKRTRDI